MTIEEFKAYTKTKGPLNTAEIHSLMDHASNEARKITFRLNSAYHTPDEVRTLLSVRTSTWAGRSSSTPAATFRTTEA